MSDFVTGRGFESQDISGPSHAEVARAEYQASLKQAAEAAIKFIPSPDLGWYHGWKDYNSGKRIKQIHNSVGRIRDELNWVTEIFQSLPKPNRSQRRAFKAITKRLHHAIDTMPRR